MSQLAKWIIATAVAAFAVSMLVMSSARAQPKAVEAESARYTQYEGAVRAASLRHRIRTEECRAIFSPSLSATLCFARNDAEWRKALALAKASYMGTAQAWAAATAEIQAADERVRKVAGQR